MNLRQEVSYAEKEGETVPARPEVPQVNGACGRRLVFAPGGAGRLILLVQPEEDEILPCSRCRANCPGQSEQSGHTDVRQGVSDAADVLEAQPWTS